LGAQGTSNSYDQWNSGDADELEHDDIVAPVPAGGRRGTLS